MRKVSTRGGTPVVLCDAPLFNGGTWTSEGMLVASLVRDSALYTVPAADGSPKLLGKLSGTDMTQRWPQALPGGESVLASGVPANGSPSIIGISTRTGEVKRLVEGAYSAHYVAGSVAAQAGSADSLYPGYLLYLRGFSLFAVGFDPAKLEVHGHEVLMLDEVGGDTRRVGTESGSRYFQRTSQRPSRKATHM